MTWIEPKTDRVAGSRTTAEDMNRICGNLEHKGFTLTKNSYTSDDIVTKANWSEIVKFAKRGDSSTTISTDYANLNKLEQAIINAEPSIPLTFTAEENTDITFTIRNTLTIMPNVQYTLDGGSTWSNYTFGTAISLTQGQSISWQGNNNTWGERYDKFIKFTSTGKVSASGNIMSLLDSTLESTIIPCNYCFTYMFINCTKLLTPPELPATTLMPNCYDSMFSGCTSITESPELPATTMDNNCYSNMFYNCSSMLTAPSLPATNLASYCYNNMFMGCTSLMEIPSLPATVLATACYQQMFSLCRAIKISETQTGEYQNEYRMPSTGTIETEAGSWNSNMFANTGGTFRGTPQKNTTYYTSNTII